MPSTLPFSGFASTSHRCIKEDGGRSPVQRGGRVERKLSYEDFVAGRSVAAFVHGAPPKNGIRDKTSLLL